MSAEDSQSQVMIERLNELNSKLNEENQALRDGFLESKSADLIRSLQFELDKAMTEIIRMRWVIRRKDQEITKVKETRALDRIELRALKKQFAEFFEDVS